MRSFSKTASPPDSLTFEAFTMRRANSAEDVPYSVREPAISALKCSALESQRRQQSAIHGKYLPVHEVAGG
jgi:hypothetical protein